MKPNEAPEKIYITPHFERRWFTKEIDDASVEYVSTDAFIEKAAEWIYLHIGELNDLYIRTAIREEFIEDFKNYMKGE